MKRVSELFEAVASTPYELALLHNDGVGYVIPEYQREYDWSKENIDRLYYDILNGFCRLHASNDASAYTFLGTIILVRQRTSEQEFSGVSLAVVDGQQRLTTLALVACSLCEVLHQQVGETDFSCLHQRTKDWLLNEAESRRMALFSCAAGSQKVDAMETFPFAKITRDGDIRGKKRTSSEYRSPIGKLLFAFADYFVQKLSSFTPPSLGESGAAEKMESNFLRIRDLVGGLNDREWYNDTECELFDINWIERSQCRSLFERLEQNTANTSDINKALSDVKNNPPTHDLVRTLLLSSYLCNCVTLTRVTTEDESSAFDIFDALNTTGAPLTALETLKPRIIKFEGSNENSRGYKGSLSESTFEKIDQNLEKFRPNTTQRQSETKELLITFALYLNGKKLSRDLAAQRLFLRQCFDEAASDKRSGEENVHRFLQALELVSTFRRFYWNREELKNIGPYHHENTLKTVQLLMRFVIDMKSSTALPVLSRYWQSNLDPTSDQNFVEALQAVSAFIILRRGATGGTAGIDHDFRSLMSNSKGSNSYGLSTGVRHEHPLLSLEELKFALKKLLKKKLKFLDKESWVNKASTNPLYQQSRDLVRFMVLAAAHQAVPSESIPGTWEKATNRRSLDYGNFLDYETWIDPRYSTVEHIAPSGDTGQWSTDLYKDEILRHSLGNLTLLPNEENSAIGASAWEKKKIWYLALCAESQSVLDDRIEQSEKAGFRFSNRLRQMLHDGQRLSLLDSLKSVEDWDRQVVTARARNIAELCWDEVWPWID